MAIRAILMLKKLDTLTDEEYFKYVEGPHTDFILNCPIVKEKGIKFSQYRVDKVLSPSLTAFGLQMLEFDSLVEFWCASREDLTAMFNDPEYQRTVIADGPDFHKGQEHRFIIVDDKNYTHESNVR